MELIRQQFILALSGELDAVGSLQKRDRESAQYGTERAGSLETAVRHGAGPAPDPVARPDQSGANWSRCVPATHTGLLAVLTGVFEKAGIDIAWAKITTLGSSVIGVFRHHRTCRAAAREALESELYAALPPPPRSLPNRQAGTTPAGFAPAGASQMGGWPGV